MADAFPAHGLVAVVTILRCAEASREGDLSPALREHRAQPVAGGFAKIGAGFTEIERHGARSLAYRGGERAMLTAARASWAK